MFDGVRRTRTLQVACPQVDVEHVPKRDQFEIEPLIPGGYGLVCIESLKNATRPRLRAEEATSKNGGQAHCRPARAAAARVPPDLPRASDPRRVVF